MNNLNVQKLQEIILAGDIPAIVETILQTGLELQASDIYIEPQSQSVSIKMRIAGQILNIIDYPLNMHSALIARIKINANLKIDEQIIPQQGKLKIFHQTSGNVEFKISTMPTMNGEKIAFQISQKKLSLIPLSELGIISKNLQNLKKSLKEIQGMILICGPKNNGKTSTIYAIINEINKPEKAIIAIENPIEYEFESITQSQIEPEIGYSLSKALQGSMNQNPDIIIVNDQNDHQFNESVLEVASSGILVIATFYADNIVSAISNLINQNIDKMKLISTLKSIQCQKLIRMICPHCKENYKPSEEVIKHIKNVLADCDIPELTGEMLQNISLVRSGGCKQCNQSGFKGNIGVYETLIINEEIKNLIIANADKKLLEQKAIENGMITMMQEGYIKALKGVTTLEEVHRVIN